MNNVVQEPLVDSVRLSSKIVPTLCRWFARRKEIEDTARKKRAKANSKHRWV